MNQNIFKQNYKINRLDREKLLDQKGLVFLEPTNCFCQSISSPKGKFFNFTIVLNCALRALGFLRISCSDGLMAFLGDHFATASLGFLNAGVSIASPGV